MKKLIVLTGHKRAGKDTAGDYLCEKYGYKKAQPLACFKKALGEWFSFSDEQMDGDKKEVVDPRWGLSPRQLFQVFGTELMREELPNRLPEHKKVVGNKLWSLVFKHWYDRQPEGKYVLCDMRFLTEYNVLKDIPNVTFVRIDNPHCTTDAHKSEQEIGKIPVDYIIDNSGSIVDFCEQINLLMLAIQHAGAYEV